MDKEIPAEEQREFLRREYDGNISLLTHWDDQLWTKNRFFLLIETAFLGVTLQFVRTQILEGVEPSLTLLYLAVFVSSFNIYLAYVWFRAVRRSREYIEARLERGKELEEILQRGGLTDGVWSSFNRSDGRLSDKGSSRWEISLPVIFIAVWFGAGVLATGLVSIQRGMSIESAAAISWHLLIVVLLLWFERGTWFKAKAIREYESNLE